MAPLSVAGYQRMIARVGEAARFPFRVHSHMLRHSCGYKLANDGQDTRAIQHYLGHRSIASTGATRRWRRIGSRGSGKSFGGLFPAMRVLIGARLRSARRGLVAFATASDSGGVDRAPEIEVGHLELDLVRAAFTQNADAARLAVSDVGVGRRGVVASQPAGIVSRP
jgi:Phage integrase family